MSIAAIFVAMPVFNGVEFVAETLRSIRNQTFEDFRVLMSVDGNDLASAEACRPFTSDPRFSLVVQPKRLDWVGNMNWLIEQCDSPYFCYWQQDDLTATNYLERLHSELLAHPEAAVAYSDVQWFGARFGRETTPSIEGSPGSRVLQSIEAIHFAVLRGLMRAEWLPREGIRVTVDEGCHSEFVLMTQMAARGSFRRVADTMYFKRAHSQNTFARWNNWPSFRRRRAWIDMGCGFWQTARNVITEPVPARLLLATILDRLTVAREGRNFFYRTDADDIHEMSRFTRDFLARCPLESVPDEAPSGFGDSATADFPPVHPKVEAALNASAQALKVRRALGDRLRRDRYLHLSFECGGEAMSLLGHGWSLAESWGVWSDGDEAIIRLPHENPGHWHVELSGHHFADPRQPAGSTARVQWRLDADDSFQTATLRGGIEGKLDLTFSTAVKDQSIRLRFPDAVFLPSVGIDDQRQVGFGLRAVTIWID